MSEETLNNLFAQARQEVPETSTADVLKWIGGGTLAMILAAYLIKFKVLLISKPLVMISSLITVAGITAGTIALLPSSEAHTPPQSKIQQIELNNGNKNNTASFYVQDSVTPEKQEKKQFTSAVDALPMLQKFDSPSPLLPLLSSLNYNAQFCRPAPEMLNVIVEEEGIGEFHAIEISGIAEVVLIQDSKNDVRIEADGLDTENLSVKNVNGVLKIHEEPAKREKDGHAVVYISFKSIDKIACTDLVHLSSQGGIELESLKIKSDGATDITLNITAKDLSLEAEGAANISLQINSEKMTALTQGASNIILEGEVGMFKLTNEGAADLKADEMQVAEAFVKAGGASKAKLYVTDNLDITANGASKVKYKGTPKMVNVNVAEAAHLGRF